MFEENPSNSVDRADAISLVKMLGINTIEMNLTPVIRAISNSLTSSGLKISRLTLANIKARTRMVSLYAIANQRNLLVAGTGDRSEILVGYFTKYGDGASDFCPIGDLYKTQLRELAVLVGLPSVFITKTPTAGLWPGQTDEGEMGMTYTELDTILYSLESGKSPQEIPAATGLPAGKVEKVFYMIHSSSHKRKLPSIPKIGIRTVGIDWNV
jgi:NAD+ synthase